MRGDESNLRSRTTMAIWLVDDMYTESADLYPERAGSDIPLRSRLPPANKTNKKQE